MGSSTAVKYLQPSIYTLSNAIKTPISNTGSLQYVYYQINHERFLEREVQLRMFGWSFYSAV